MIALNRLITGIIITVVLLIFRGSIFGAEISGVIVSIRDGDSVEILDDLDKVTFRVRLEDIDAPEKEQPFYTASKKKLSDLCYKKHVTIRFKKIDRFGRIVGNIKYGDTDVSLEMLRSGMAWHFKRYSKVREYAEAEDKARISRAGLWSDSDPVPPWNWRSKALK